MKHSVVWSGRSGNGHSFDALPLNESVADAAGVYVFCRRNPIADGWVAICIGETESFLQFLSAHPKRQCARDHAATHLHVLSQDDATTRRAIVQDLIARWHPPCNQTLADTIVSREQIVMSS